MGKRKITVAKYVRQYTEYSVDESAIPVHVLEMLDEMEDPRGGFIYEDERGDGGILRMAEWLEAEATAVVLNREYNPADESDTAVMILKGEN